MKPLLCKGDESARAALAALEHKQSAQTIVRSISILPRAGRQTPESRKAGKLGMLSSVALVLRGEAYRGFPDYQNRKMAMDTDRRIQGDSWRKAQRKCSFSLATRLIEPLTAAGSHVGVFVTAYPGTNVSDLTYAYDTRVVAVTYVNRTVPPGDWRNTDQIPTTHAAVVAFIRTAALGNLSYTGVILTRYDLHFKQNVAALLLRQGILADLVFPWREVGGDWRDGPQVLTYPLLV